MPNTGERADVRGAAALDSEFDAFLDDAVATDDDHRAARTGTMWALAAIPVAFAGSRCSPSSPSRRSTS